MKYKITEMEIQQNSESDGVPMDKARYVSKLDITSKRKCNDAWLVIGEDTEGVEYFCTFPPESKPTWKDILEAQERNDFQLL